MYLAKGQNLSYGTEEWDIPSAPTPVLQHFQQIVGGTRDWHWTEEERHGVCSVLKRAETKMGGCPKLGGGAGTPKAVLQGINRHQPFGCEEAEG